VIASGAAFLAREPKPIGDWTRNVVLDSDILIDHLRGFKPAKDIMIKVGKREVAALISSVTEAELLSGAECKDLRKRNLVGGTIKLFTKVSVPLLDGIVGATAFYKRAELWTETSSTPGR
jgi:predicted nucleic acid-binding protein